MEAMRSVNSQSRKHSLSPVRSPNPGVYNENEEDEEQLLESSIKKLKIDSESHVNVPLSRPLNKRLPKHVESQDDPDYMHDINFPEVNKLLNELAIIREFREKVKELRQNTLMPTISEHLTYDYEVPTHVSPPQTILNFAPYAAVESTGNISDGNCGELEPMEMDSTADDDDDFF
mmetsp:Transcript_9994/g.16593  ORF Transcript_9994/g.16593 Transcript_9994/m.16593 type:complete len:175 (-) Transcript_9994:40-564(-)